LLPAEVLLMELVPGLWWSLPSTLQLGPFVRSICNR